MGQERRFPQMRSRPSDFVRVVLPLIPLAIFPGCGGPGPETLAATEAPAAQAPTTQAPVTPVTTGASRNRAPTIDGDANNVARVGAEYVFQPSSVDADGDELTYRANNLPPWATLDVTTGRLSGRPGAADIGAYESISIIVADASHEVSTREFTINVVGASNGVAKLEWPAPVSKVDGSLLDDLAGYRILYGHDPEDLDHSVFISNPDVRTYEFATLEAGTWYFSVVAINAGGEEGPATQPQMKII